MDPLDTHIIAFLRDHAGSSSKMIHRNLTDEVGYATVKRRLKDLVDKGYVTMQGQARATRYSLHDAFDIVAPIDVETYFNTEADERSARTGFNHALIEILARIEIFTSEEKRFLESLDQKHRQRMNRLSPGEQKREMERLAIDLSWKSAQIEGNTYSLLETERLLKEKLTAEGKTMDEATMLLNHKEAIDFIVSQPDYLFPLEVRAIEDIHSILVKDLGVDRNLRQRGVGISGTSYRPIDNAFQIREAMIDMCRLVNAQKNPYARGLLLLLLVSYIQPFTDGNKRTARIVANALLLVGGYCPLSFRTVDPLNYKKAMLLFYETNNIIPFKEMFIAQAEFAVENYF